MHVILHIGAEKTGTTALQGCFHSNRDLLAEAGILYPQSLRSPQQHWALALYALDDDREHLLGDRMPMFGKNRERWRARLARQLETEIAASGTPDVLLLSSEILGAQIMRPSELGRLRRLLDRWCDDYRVVLYLRRQDRARISLHSTDLRVGGTSPEPLGELAFPGNGFDYGQILDLWATEFGRAQVVPRVYERVGPDGLVDDFVAASGLRLPVERLTRPRTGANPALSARAQRIMREFNLLQDGPAVTRQQQRVRRQLAAVLASAFPGAPRRPSRADARAYVERYRDDNARIADTWFGGDELFDDDFDEYPEVADPEPELVADDVLRVLSTLAPQLVAEPEQEN